MYFVRHRAGIEGGRQRQGDLNSTVADSEGTGQSGAVIGNTTSPCCARRR